MAVSKAQKAEIIASLVEKFKNAESIGFATTSTITVDQFAELRTGLREVDASYTLAKKTLMKIALKEAKGIDIDLSTMEGQIGAVCSNGDAVAGLGKVNDFIKENKDVASWATCVFEGEVKSKEETIILAAMPSRDTLLGRMVGSLQSPLSGLARLLDAISKEAESTGKEKAGELE
ncbi:MAG: 50S ribosomal protein L10 [Patescibacteria group bacterium]|nr:50S ribosomal protein L10 [Patescibacteria group bacterium]